MRNGLFITGTGTGVGKTLVTAGVVRCLKGRGINVVPMKPVQTGGVPGPRGLAAPDLEFALAAAKIALQPREHEMAAPYVYEPACSPHLAGRMERRYPQIPHIRRCAEALLERHDFIVAEGAGGILVPLDESHTMLDLMKELGFPVLLVTHDGLGTINHTLLSLQILRGAGLEVLGVIFNTIVPPSPEDEFVREDNPKTIARLGDVRDLGHIRHLEGIAPDRADLWDWFEHDAASALSTLAAVLSPQSASSLVRSVGSDSLQSPISAIRNPQSAIRNSQSSLWLPCTPINALEQKPCPAIERAEGVRLFEAGGRPLLDGIASWWCVNLGHGHPKLVDAIQRQAGVLQHSILGGMVHPRAIELAERLAALAPEGLNRCFFASDGASAVEAALKIAVQYWANIGAPGRSRFIALQDGYHGDTIGAMGVGYVEVFHRDFRDIVRPAYRALSPHCARCPRGKDPQTCDIECFDSMREIVEEHHRETAAVIVEPLCQGAAGMRIYPEEYLRRLRALCDRYELLLIADEIAVGFGRTGSLFACERAGIAPDIMTVGKGLTGGYLPMSAVIARDAIYDSFRETADRDRTFYHSHTFGGNPIAAAVALAALDVYREENVLARCHPRIEQLAGGMRELAESLGGSKWRALGMIGVVEVNDASGGAARAKRIGRLALELGLFIRPLGRAVYLWPPLVTTSDELDEMLSILKASATQTA